MAPVKKKVHVVEPSLSPVEPAAAPGDDDAPQPEERPDVPAAVLAAVADLPEPETDDEEDDDDMDCDECDDDFDDEDPLFHISQLLVTEDGEAVSDVLAGVRDALEKLNKIVFKLATVIERK